MDNVFINNRIMEDSSEDSSEESSSDNEDIFLDNGSKKKYEMIRNKFFTKNVSKKIIVVDSHNYYQGDVGFNTSNFDVLFDFEKKKKEDSSSMVTTNYNIFQNVIGFRLLKATIRTPPYNVNKTNKNSYRIPRIKSHKQNFYISLCLLFLTISAGAWVSGTDAGLSYNNFPLMGDSFLPPILSSENDY